MIAIRHLDGNWQEESHLRKEVLNGMDFINNQPIPLGVYKIET